MKRFKTVCLAFVMAATLAGCSAVRDFAFGPAETPQQHAYRAVLVYTGLATIAADQHLVGMDQDAFAACERLQAAADKGEPVDEPAADVRGALRRYAVSAGLGVKPKASIIGIAFTVLTKVGSVTIQARRVKAAMKNLDMEDRDPTPEEVASAWALARQAHAEAQGSGS